MKSSSVMPSIYIQFRHGAFRDPDESSHIARVSAFNTSWAHR
jgi:hypothetical protein